MAWYAVLALSLVIWLVSSIVVALLLGRMVGVYRWSADYYQDP
jgi:hypothetical protein